MEYDAECIDRDTQINLLNYIIPSANAGHKKSVQRYLRNVKKSYKRWSQNNRGLSDFEKEAFSKYKFIFATGE